MNTIREAKNSASTRLQLYEVEFSPEKISERYRLPIEDILDFSLNVNPYGPPASAVMAAKGALNAAGRYPDVRLRELRQKIAGKLDVDGNSLFFGAGLDDVLKLIVLGLTKPGDEALVHAPAFPRYQLECQLAGVKVESVENDPPWEISVLNIRKTLLKGRTRLAFLCTPNNPSGARIADRDVESLVHDFRDTIFVVDEALIDPALPGVVPLCSIYPNMLVLRTFSKFYGLAGYRVGFAVGSPTLVAELEEVRPPFNVSSIAAAAACAALDDTAFCQQTRERIAAERKAFEESIALLEHVRVCSAYSNMVLLETLNQASTELCETLASKGILVVDGKSFVGLEAQNTIRISLQDREANARLISEIARLN